MVSHVVGRDCVHAAFFVNPFRLWNAVFLSNNSEVLSIPVLSSCALLQYDECGLYIEQVLDFE